MTPFQRPVPSIAAALAAVLVLGSAGSVEAQSRRDRDRDRNDATSDALVGAAIGALAGAVIGNGDGSYIAGGALAGAAIGAASADDDRRDCAYWRDGRCYRNQGHWEREHGINSRDRRERRDDDRRRDYRYDRRW